MQWIVRKQQSLNALTPAAQFYGPGMSTHNLEIVSRFFEKYPEYTERAFLMVKVNAYYAMTRLGAADHDDTGRP